MSQLQQFLKHQTPDLSKIPRDSWFDNSTIETFQNCPRLAWYSYSMGMEQKSAPMAAGTVWHAALAKLHQTGNFQSANIELARSYEANKGILQLGANRLSFGNLNLALSEYEKTFGNDSSITYHEQEFKFAIWFGDCPEGDCAGTVQDCKIPFGQCPKNHHIEGEPYCFWFVGRFDGIITFMGDLLLLENKTASQFNNVGLEMSRQASGYVYAIQKILAANGYTGPKLKGVLFNVVKLGTKIEFSRFTAIRHDKHLLEWEDEIKDLVFQIRQSWRGQKKPIKNTQHCTRYGQCQFIPLCQSWVHSDRDKPPSQITNYQVSRWRPF